MELLETLMWYGVALAMYGVLSTLYRMNPLYDTVEGLAMGSAGAVTLFSNFNTINTSIYLPLTRNFATNAWLLIAVTFGLLYFTVYTPRFRELFRFVSAIGVGVVMAVTVITNSTAIWQQVYRSAQVSDIGFAIVWIFFIFGTFYFIYAQKFEKALTIPRNLGRWVLVFGLAAQASPMWMRYGEDLIGWSVKVYQSPAWWIPYLVFAFIAIDALGRKFGLFGKPKQQIEAKV